MDKGNENQDFVIDKGVLIKYNGKDSEVEVPSGVRAIEMTVFQVQETLKKVVIPEGVKELRGHLFYQCSNLETVILPDTIENIPPTTFAGCVSLKSITLPKNLKHIGDNAFVGCEKLTSIEIPPNVETVRQSVFSGCESLETIFCYENTIFTGTDYRYCESFSSINVLDRKTGEPISKNRIEQAKFSPHGSTGKNNANGVKFSGNVEFSEGEVKPEKSIDIFKYIRLLVLIIILIFVATRVYGLF